MARLHPGRILYVDDHILAVYKLPQELVVRGAGEVGKLPLLDFLRTSYPGIRPIHRLDYDTSGVVLFARTKEVLATVIASSFAGWRKTYRTFVAGPMPLGPGHVRTALPGQDGGKLLPAQTDYEVLKSFPDCSYVEAVIERGRHHQIRRHFAGMAHALVLDDTYGNRDFNSSFSKRYGFRRFFLHAFSVTFPHPVTGAVLTVTSPLPPAFHDALERLSRGGRLPLRASGPKRGRPSGARVPPATRQAAARRPVRGDSPRQP